MDNLQLIKGVHCFIGPDGLVQLHLEDVARGLGFTQTQNKNGKEYVSVRWERIDSYLASFMDSPTNGGRPEFIPEPIFYLLAMKADNRAAREFQRLVAYEILPAIRKHGVYAVDALLDDPDLAIKAFTALKEERAKRAALESRIEADRPKVLFADAVAASKAPMLIGELAKILKQNGIDTGKNACLHGCGITAT